MKAKSKSDYWREFRGSRALFEHCWRKARRLRCLEIVGDHDTGMWIDIYAGKAVNNERSRFWIHG